LSGTLETPTLRGCLTRGAGCGATEGWLAWNAGICQTAFIGALAPQTDGPLLCLGANNNEVLENGVVHLLRANPLGHGAPA